MYTWIWQKVGVFFSEHQEISNEINEATDTKVREDLERELEALVSRMEAKSQQISKVRKHQQKVCMWHIYIYIKMWLDSLSADKCNRIFFWCKSKVNTILYRIIWNIFWPIKTIYCRVREYLKFSVGHRTDRMQISASPTNKLVVLQFVKLLTTKDD
jgi:hypothetical protein